jgi:hypothetical protein
MLAEIAGCDIATRCAPFVKPPVSATAMKCMGDEYLFAPFLNQ